MFEKIKNKLKKMQDETEKKDILFIKKHPKIWKGTMIFYVCFFGIIFLIGSFTDKNMIVLLLVFIFPLYLIEKEMFERYKKALKKIN